MVPPFGDTMEAVDALIARLRTATLAQREEVKAQLRELASGKDGASVRDHLDSARRQELLEIQWEIEEVLEATTPKKAEAPKPAAPPPPPEKEDPNRPLTAKDLVLVYDDPRGLLLHRSKVGDRWFATQVDPRSGQPQTFELHPQEIGALKQQLAGSPYWVVGAGGLTSPTPAPKPAAPLGGGAATMGPARPGPKPPGRG